MAHSGKHQLLILWSMFFFLCIVLAIMAYNQYPIMDGDARFFLPHAISYATHTTLIDPFAKMCDPSGQGRLVYHGFLPQIVTGKLCLSPTYFTLRLVLVSINIASIMALLLFLLRVPWRHQPLEPSAHGGISPWRLTLIIASLLAFATYTSGYGRPELFAAALLMAGLLCWQRLPECWEVLCIGITLGLVTAANPLPGIMLFFISGILFCVKYKATKAIASIALTVVLLLLVFFIPFLFYPYSFHDWVLGMEWNGKHQFTRGDTGQYLHYWFLEPGRTFLGGVFLLGVCASLFLTSRNWTTIQFRSGFVLFSLILAVVIWETAIRAPIRNYGMLVVTPILFALILNALNDLLVSRQRFSSAIAAISILTIALGSVSFLREIAAFLGFLRAGLPYRQAQSDFSALRRQYPGSLGITSGLFTLTEDYTNISGYERDTPPKTDDLMIQQTNTGWQEPPNIPGYRIVKNTFRASPCRLFGIKVANTPQGYNFACYVRN